MDTLHFGINANGGIVEFTFDAEEIRENDREILMRKPTNPQFISEWVYFSPAQMVFYEIRR